MPAVQVEPGIPVHVTAVRPVRRQRAFHERAQGPGLTLGNRPHALSPRLVVVVDRVEHDVRVLGRLDVLLRAGALERIAMEAVARTEIGYPPGSRRPLRAVQETHQLLPVVAAQQRRVAGHADRARLQLGGEVDLVQPHVRVAEERRPRDGAHRLNHPRDQRLGQPQRLARAPRVVQSAGRLGVDRQVHRGVEARHARDPSGSMDLGLRAWVGVLRGASDGERARGATRTGARPAVPRARRSARAPSWPSNAAIACVISAHELIRVSFV